MKQTKARFRNSQSVSPNLDNVLIPPKLLRRGQLVLFIFEFNIICLLKCIINNGILWNFMAFHLLYL